MIPFQLIIPAQGLHWLHSHKGITIQSSSSSSVRSTMIQGSASRGTTRPGPWTPDEELAFPQRFLSFMRS